MVGGVWGEGNCVAVRHEMLSFRPRAEMYFLLRNLPAGAVGWLRKPCQPTGHGFWPLARGLGRVDKSRARWLGNFQCIFVEMLIRIFSQRLQFLEAGKIATRPFRVMELSL